MFLAQAKNQVNSKDVLFVDPVISICNGKQLFWHKDKTAAMP